MPYLTPDTLDEALGVLADAAVPGPADGPADGPVEVIAGGTDWFPARGNRPFEGTLLDITRLPGLRGISRTVGGWRMGGATTWTDVLRADLPPAFDGLKLAAREVGSVQIQNAGTLAGNICNASPAADGVPPLLTLNAEVELTSARGQRRLPLGDFITGVRSTERAADELVTALYFPDPHDACGGFIKLGARAYLVISITMVAAVLRLRDGRLSDVRIAVGAAAPVACRLPDLEAALQGARVEEVAGLIRPEHLSGLAPISDIRGSADYRLDVVAECIARAVLGSVSGVVAPANGG